MSNWEEKFNVERDALLKRIEEKKHEHKLMIDEINKLIEEMDALYYKYTYNYNNNDNENDNGNGNGNDNDNDNDKDNGNDSDSDSDSDNVNKNMKEKNTAGTNRNQFLESDVSSSDFETPPPSGLTKKKAASMTSPLPSCGSDGKWLSSPNVSSPDSLFVDIVFPRVKPSFSTSSESSSGSSV